MRKLSLLISSCIAVVALAAFSATALAVTKVDSRCDLDHPEWGDDIAGPYNNDVEIHGFRIEYTSKVEHQVAGYTAEGLACGTEISTGELGVGTLYNNAKVRQAPGEVTSSTDPADGIPLTSYVGDGIIRAASFVGSSPAMLDQPFSLRTDAISACELENDENLVGGPEPGQIVACYKGTATGPIGGHNWNYVVEQGARDVTVIGPFYNDATGKPAGLTSVGDITDAELKGFTLCAYAGATDLHGKTGFCGEDPLGPGGTDYSKPLRRNGDYSVGGPMPVTIPSPPVAPPAPPAVWPPPKPKGISGGGGHSCGTGYGNISVTATQNNGTTTPPFRLCTSWYPRPPAPPHP